MGFGNMRKFCCFPLATACVLAAFCYIMYTIGIFYSSDTDGKYVIVVLNLAIAILLLLGMIMKNWIMFAILTVLCACDFFFAIVMMIITFIALSSTGFKPLLPSVMVVIMVILILLFSALCLNICYSMCKILQAGGTGWEGKSAQEIEAEKETPSSKLEKGRSSNEEHNVQ